MDTHPVPSGASDRSAWGGGVSGFPEFAVIAALMFAALPFLFAETLYAPALPVFVKLYHAPVSDVSWLLTGHLLFAAVATPIGGRLGDLYGRGRLLVIACLITFVATVIAGLAVSLPMLIAGRVLQGMTVAAVPLSLSVVRDALRPERVALGVGLLSAVFGLGSGFGFLLAGPIIQHLGVHWLSWSVAIVAGVAAALLAMTVMRTGSESAERRGVD